MQIGRVSLRAKSGDASGGRGWWVEPVVGRAWWHRGRFLSGDGLVETWQEKGGSCDTCHRFLGTGREMGSGADEWVERPVRPWCSPASTWPQGTPGTQAEDE